jgi:hypothetical protein
VACIGAADKAGTVAGTVVDTVGTAVEVGSNRDHCCRYRRSCCVFLAPWMRTAHCLADIACAPEVGTGDRCC